MATGGDCPNSGGNNGGTPRRHFSYEPADIPVHDPVEDVSGDDPAGAVGGGGDISDHPATPRVFCEPEDPPDTEENVRSQTDGVFRSFVIERYTRDREQGRQPGTPSSPEFASEHPDPLSNEARIGRQLAEIGDDIQRRYQTEFDEMIKALDGELTDAETSFDTFRRVAMRLFRDGINWGRVVALFLFGYRIAVEKISHGVSGFVRQVVNWICRFLVLNNITRWIADHGGWRSATHMAIQTLDWPLFIGLVTLAASACFVVFRLSHR